MDPKAEMILDGAVRKINQGETRAVCHLPKGTKQPDVRNYLRETGYKVRFSGTIKTGWTVTLTKQ